MKKLTQWELKKQLDYNPQTGVMKWKIKKRGSNYVGQIIKCEDNNGYLICRINQQNHRVHRLAWLYMKGYIPEHGIDHINGNKKDNSISNLREVSQSCNLRNCGNFKNSHSGVRGVFWDNSREKWLAEIVICRRKVHLCRSNDFDEAVCHRYAAEQCVDWVKCKQDSPAYIYLKAMGILHEKSYS